jgi:predicted esterase
MPPHAGQPVLTSGPPISEARSLGILIHGRGASADDILGLGHEFARQDILWVAPHAAGNVWYPFSFLSPLQVNEPGLSSALSVVEEIVREAGRNGIPSERVVLMGFSQGACLVLEYAARSARRYAAVVGFSGGLIGPEGTPRDYSGGFDGTPIFFGCSDRDPHIPSARVTESAEVFERMGASVDLQLYENMPHTIIKDEIDRVSALLGALH